MSCVHWTVIFHLLNIFRTQHAFSHIRLCPNHHEFQAQIFRGTQVSTFLWFWWSILPKIARVVPILGPRLQKLRKEPARWKFWVSYFWRSTCGKNMYLIVNDNQYFSCYYFALCLLSWSFVFWYYILRVHDTQNCHVSSNIFLRFSALNINLRFKNCV